MEVIRTGTAFLKYIQVPRGEQPWPCSLVVDHISEPADATITVTATVFFGGGGEGKTQDHFASCQPKLDKA